MASGTLNENFVRINIKKKKFSRGHKSINIKKLKWKKWKEYKKFGGNSGNSPISSSVCFKCGQVGHWAKNCSSVNSKVFLFIYLYFRYKKFSLCLVAAKNLCFTFWTVINSSYFVLIVVLYFFSIFLDVIKFITKESISN